MSRRTTPHARTYIVHLYIDPLEAAGNVYQNHDDFLSAAMNL
jgi:hypothetical protein